MNIGAQLLLEARERANLTQSELGRRVGQPASVISRWERGEVTMKVDRLVNVIRGCGLQLDFGLRRADDSSLSLMTAYVGLSPVERIEMLERRLQTIGAIQHRKERFAPGRLLSLLSKEGVGFVLIGRVAETVHGAPETTYGLDIVPKPGPQNAKRLSRALARADAAKASAQDGLDAYDTSWGLVQVIETPAGTDGYRDLASSAMDVVIEGATIQVAALIDLIRSKDALGRPAERASLSDLRQLALLSS